MESINHTTILGIDPGTRFLGLAVLRGNALVHYAVRTLRNGSRPYDLLGQARRHVLAGIRDYEPSVVAIEEPLLLPTRRAALVSAVAQELHERALELGIRVLELSPGRVREMAVGNSKAGKIEVASRLVAQGFRELEPLIPKVPVHAVLGLGRDRYWFHAIDALALCVAARSLLRITHP
jgi:Holliday junction resolvasome RuvABC endonuclease subunit